MKVEHEINVVDEDLQELFDLPYSGLEMLEAAEFGAVYAQWHGKAEGVVATLTLLDRNGEPDGWVHGIKWAGCYWTIDVNENMNVDAVVKRPERDALMTYVRNLHRELEKRDTKVKLEVGA